MEITEKGRQFLLDMVVYGYEQAWLTDTTQITPKDVCPNLDIHSLSAMVLKEIDGLTEPQKSLIFHLANMSAWREGTDRNFTTEEDACEDCTHLILSWVFYCINRSIFKLSQVKLFDVAKANYDWRLPTEVCADCSVESAPEARKKAGEV